jgi:hypothetical protein
VGCVVLLFAIISPRLALFATWIFTDHLGDAFSSWVLPVLGFLLLPWTTLAYAWMWATGTHGVTDFEWFLVALGFLVDVGAFKGSRDWQR